MPCSTTLNLSVQLLESSAKGSQEYGEGSGMAAGYI